eukprot:1682041-Prymnesium_polylepis.1
MLPDSSIMMMDNGDAHPLVRKCRRSVTSARGCPKPLWIESAVVSGLERTTGPSSDVMIFTPLPGVARRGGASFERR